jgi:hypothetical protein
MKAPKLNATIKTTIVLLLIASVPSTAAPIEEKPDSLKTPQDFHHTKWRFVRTSAEVVGFNLLMTAFGRYIMEPDGDGFKVTWESIEENLIAGMEWDDNSFNANNWRHPYQGAMYFNAARANGYDFYQSSAFSFAGAWLWEYTGERHHPAYNDWINTAVGGIIYGEALYRLSDMVIDNTATGGGRTGREIACLLISPTRGVNRLLTGEAFAVHQNPPDRIPSSFHGDFKVGLRVLGEERLWSASKTKAFIGASMFYGEKLGTIGGKPFDYFDLHFQLNFQNSPHQIGLFNINGLLYAWDRGGSETTESQVNTYIHTTYVDNEAYTYGGQSLSASYQRRFGIGNRLEHELEINLEGIILGASKSDYFNLSNREYDYGPGLGLRAYYSLLASDLAAFRALYRGSWIHSINGTVADHWDNYLGFSTSVDIRDWFDLGIDYYYYRSQRYYRDYPDVTAKNPMLQLYFSWNF